MAGKTGGAGAKKHGRDKEKCASYKGRHTRDQNKAVRVARSSGVKWALEYAAQHGIGEWARKRLVKFVFGR